VLECRAVNKVRQKFTTDLIQAEVDIRLRHPLLCLVKSWMDKQMVTIQVIFQSLKSTFFFISDHPISFLYSFQSKLTKDYQWKCHEEAIEACRKASLNQLVYFLSRDLAFLKEVFQYINHKNRETTEMLVSISVHLFSVRNCGPINKQRESFCGTHGFGIH